MKLFILFLILYQIRAICPTNYQTEIINDCIQFTPTLVSFFWIFLDPFSFLSLSGIENSSFPSSNKKYDYCSYTITSNDNMCTSQFQINNNGTLSLIKQWNCVINKTSNSCMAPSIILSIENNNNNNNTKNIPSQILACITEKIKFTDCQFKKRKK